MSQTHVPVALRRLVRERARDRCEYCRIPEQVTLARHWIDHVVAEKHGGATESENLALACALCNQHKGTDLSSVDPASGEIVALFNPRQHQWEDHFTLVGPRFEALTSAGRVTIRLLQLNHPDRVQERALLFGAGLL